jgi:tetratricopeptide (TPR) repeat protein
MSNKADNMRRGTPIGSAGASASAYPARSLRGMIGALTLALAVATGAPITEAFAASEAEKLLRVGDLSGAWSAASAEVEARPLDVDAQERRIDIALSMGLRELILPELRTLARGAPDRADPHYLLGRIALEPSEAEAFYRVALERDPQHARAHMGIGAIRRATGKLSEAATSYRRALELDPSLAEAWAGLQAALLQAGDVAGAVDAARRAMRAIPGEPDPYIAVATLEPARALDVLRAGVGRVPDDPRLRTALARAQLDAGDGAGAAEQVAAALRLAPGFPEAGYLAMVAREHVERRLDTAGWRDLQAAQRLEARAEALAAFQSLVERYPRSGLAWLGLGKIRADGGDLELAATDLARAASVSGDEAEVLATLGIVLLRARRPDEAVGPLSAAARARPADVALGIALVQAAAGAGRAAEARELAVDLVRRHPSDLRAIFQAAQLLSAQGDREAAYLVLRQSVPNQPDPRLLVALAAAARDAGYYAEAAEILERLATVLELPRARELADQLKREELQRRSGGAPR